MNQIAFPALKPLQVADSDGRSPNEERWILAAEAADRPTYLSFFCEIRGPLRPARLRAAAQAVCDRHRALRDAPFDQAPAASRRAQRVHFETARAPKLAADAARVMAERRLRRALDAAPGRAAQHLLVKLGADRYVFAFAHAAARSDLASVALAAREIFQAYDGDLESVPAPDFRSMWDWSWRESDEYLVAEAAWRRQLANADEVAGLPAERVAPPGQAPGAVILPLPPALAARADAVASRLGLPTEALARAVFAVALSRLTDQAQVFFTIEDDGRSLVPGAQGVVGPFSNRLILAPRVDEDQSLEILARAIEALAQDARAGQICPYHHVTARTGVAPRFSMAPSPTAPALAARGLVISAVEVRRPDEDADLDLDFSACGQTLTLRHAPGVGSARAEAAGRTILGLMEALLDAPGQPLRATPSRALAASADLPDPDAPLAPAAGRLIPTAFLARAAAAPEAVALRQGDQSFTYGDLETRSRRLAAELHAQGVRGGDRVAILAGRGPALVWSVLAVSRLGGVFAVLDSAYPEPRLAALCAVAAPKAILCTAPGLSDIAHRLVPAGVPVLEAGLAAAFDGPLLPADALDRGDPAQPAYLLFTSGSTGTPKCVAASHIPLTHFVDWQARAFGLTGADRFTMLAGLSHDPLLRDIFTPLSLGAALAIPDQADIFEPGRLRAWFADQRPTATHMTPAMAQLLTAQAGAALDSLRCVFMGGDQLRPGILQALGVIAPNAAIHNFYGATETPQAVGCFRFDGDLTWKALPIGRGVGGAQILVLGRDGKAKGVGELGEVAVRSAYLSLGYVQAGGLDQTPAPAELYRTGDRGFHLPGGDVVLLGRQDDQVKIRGYRVDLSEVTAALLAHPQVTMALTLAHGQAEGRRVIAFAAGKAGLASETLMVDLARRVPGYMAPAALHVLPSLPLLPNGKVDRQALLALHEASETAEVSAPAADPVEAELMARWARALNRPIPSTASTFASLGGDSLSYVQVYLATEEVLGAAPDGWQFLSIAELARSGARPNRFFGSVDTTVLIRAISIFMVVSGHFLLFDYGGGATAALFLVSGFMIGEFQLTETFLERRVKPLVRLLVNIALPTFLFTIPLQLGQIAAGHPVYLSTLLFAANAPYRDQEDNIFFLWYVHCLFQMVAILTLFLWAMLRTRRGLMGKQAFLWAMFAGACVTRFVLPLFVFPDFISGGGHSGHHDANFLPTSQMATLLLGALAASAATHRARLWVLAVLVPYAALTYNLFETSSWIFVTATTVLLLFVNRVPLVRPLNRIVAAVSGASLFIYLTHFLFKAVLTRAIGVDDARVSVAFALAGGVGVWLAWNAARPGVSRQVARIMGRVAGRWWPRRQELPGALGA